MIKPLLLGDTLTRLRELPDALCDAGVTSPPYNKQENKKGWLVSNVKYQGASDKQDEAAYQSQQIAVLDELFRVTKPGGSFFYNHKVRWERGAMLHPMAWLSCTRWTIRQEIIWDRQIAANIRGWRFWQVDERIYWLHKPDGAGAKAKIGRELESRHAKLTSVWRFPPERGNPHPAPFPLILPARALCSVLRDQAGMVIDPYCGSGTTLAAAKLLGHAFVGIDISKAYINMARNRLKHCEQERPALAEEQKRHQINGSFRERKARGGNVGKFAPSRGNGTAQSDLNNPSPADNVRKPAPPR